MNFSFKYGLLVILIIYPFEVLAFDKPIKKLNINEIDNLSRTEPIPFFKTFLTNVTSFSLVSTSSYFILGLGCGIFILFAFQKWLTVRKFETNLFNPQQLRYIKKF